MTDDLAAYRRDFEAIEHRVAREFDTGRRLPVLIGAVALLVVGLFLPHAESVSGWTALTDTSAVHRCTVTAPLRLFVCFMVVFGIVASTVALWTRRWALAWFAMAGTGVGTVLGLLACWSQQSLPVGTRPDGLPYGLVMTWAVMAVLTALWVPVVWSRTNVMQDDPM
ncbi:Rv2732c family membrane protein [Rhodococcus tukisamuensis]|uniref:Transmembrane protein n=1 Tax=Rhodococcus tukisamuensis TaxID=168276 RepID=A0A1G6WYS6_9NOCA|nr:hypothetical protein [Rhodococcus tukisamuensis]SDD70155.1 hypothetical protein SAMN05444580_1062 [Rhodococcus tukisamuensis]